MTDFPDDFQGPGPMYAAVPLGEAWLHVATRDATTYVIEDYPEDPGMDENQIRDAYEEHAGYSAFLDQGQIEVLADARNDGTYTRWDGLSGSLALTPKAEATYAAQEAEWENCGAPEAGS